MTIPIIIDTDPGIDDAAMLAVALTNPEFDVRLITTVAGNVDINHTTENALKLVEFFHRQDVPVARGAEKPLVRDIENASHIHGESGLGDFDFPTPSITPLTAHAVDAIAAAIAMSKEPLTIVATGAYTNIANFLTTYPDQRNKIKEIIAMGGSLSSGNMTSVAEFNVFSDPDAAEILLNSGIPVKMIGLDVTLKALLTEETQAQIEFMNQSGKMISQLISYYKDSEQSGKPMHDVVTLFYLLNPYEISFTKYWIDVIKSGPAIGATVADIRGAYHKNSNAFVSTNINADTFNHWFLSQIAQMP